MSAKMYFNNEEIEKMILSYQSTGDESIFEELRPVFDKLIKGVMGRYKLARRNYINDDLYQEAWVGILEVTKKWDKNRGDAFSLMTATVRNKIYWYLKGQYDDTSYNSEQPDLVSMNDPDANVDPSDDKCHVEQFVITDFIDKIKLEELDIPNTEKNSAIVEAIKSTLCANSLIEYNEIAKSIQKNSRIPKKDVKTVLDSIYRYFCG